MQIAILTLDFPPFRTSGLTIYAESVVRALTERGHIVTVITSMRSADRWTEEIKFDEEVEIERLRIGRFDWIGFGFQAARYLSAHSARFDAVHFMDVHFAYAYHGAFTASILQSFRQRLMSTGKGPYHSNWRNYLFRLTYYNAARWLMERPAVARARHLVATSQSTRREFVQHYGVDSEKTSTIYIGIDSSRFSKLPDKASARSGLGLPSDLPILLYVGFSTPRKGLEHLAHALTIMHSRAHLVIVGKWEEGYRSRFLKALGDARSRVTITGYVADCLIPDYYAAADVFVLPTLLEGFGIPLVEAMSAGLPIVTTNGGSAGEIVRQAGLVIPREDSRALAIAIDRILMDPNLAHTMRAHAVERVRLFNEDLIADQINEMFTRRWNAAA